MPDGASDATTGVVTGGPCASGATGATLVRVRFDDVGGAAEVVYEADGTPDHSGLVGVYGYMPGFTPPYYDDIGGGGLRLDSNDFIDLSASTAAITNLQSATLSIYGSGIGGASGFGWQSPQGTGMTTTSFVGVTLPYTWYSADVTAALQVGISHALLRIKTLASQNGIIVAKLELCVAAT